MRSKYALAAVVWSMIVAITRLYVFFFGEGNDPRDLV